MRTCVAHMRMRGSFDFASIERARRILETDMLQFLIASVPLQSAKNSPHEDCSLSGQFWQRIARYLNRMHQRGCRVDILQNASGMRLFLSELDRFDILPVLRLWFSAFLYLSLLQYLHYLSLPYMHNLEYQSFFLIFVHLVDSIPGLLLYYFHFVQSILF